MPTQTFTGHVPVPHFVNQVPGVHNAPTSYAPVPSGITQPYVAPPPAVNYAQPMPPMEPVGRPQYNAVPPPDPGLMRPGPLARFNRPRFSTDGGPRNIRAQNRLRAQRTIRPALRGPGPRTGGPPRGPRMGSPPRGPRMGSPPRGPRAGAPVPPLLFMKTRKVPPKGSGAGPHEGPHSPPPGPRMMCPDRPPSAPRMAGPNRPSLPNGPPRMPGPNRPPAGPGMMPNRPPTGPQMRAPNGPPLGMQMPGPNRPPGVGPMPGPHRQMAPRVPGPQRQRPPSISRRPTPPPLPDPGHPVFTQPLQVKPTPPGPPSRPPSLGPSRPLPVGPSRPAPLKLPNRPLTEEEFIRMKRQMLEEEMLETDRMMERTRKRFVIHVSQV